MTSEYVKSLIKKVDNEEYYRLAVVDLLGTCHQGSNMEIVWVTEESPDEERYSIRSKQHVEIYGFKVVHKNY